MNAKHHLLVSYENCVFSWELWRIGCMELGNLMVSFNFCFRIEEGVISVGVI